MQKPCVGAKKWHSTHRTRAPLEEVGMEPEGHRLPVILALNTNPLFCWMRPRKPELFIYKLEWGGPSEAGETL